MRVLFRLDVWGANWQPVGPAILHDDTLRLGHTQLAREHRLEYGQANWTRKSDLLVQENRRFLALAIAESKKDLTSLTGIVEANSPELASPRRKDQFQSDG